MIVVNRSAMAYWRNMGRRWCNNAGIHCRSNRVGVARSAELPGSVNPLAEEATSAGRSPPQEPLVRGEMRHNEHIEMIEL